jgi:ABC-2 type transport system ATP-binding protein
VQHLVTTRTATLTVLAAALALLAALVPTVAVAEEGHTRSNEVVEGAEGTAIAITVHRPAGATAETPVPVILHSHGWGGSRNSSEGAFGRELDRGFAVVSIDQRGFGQSGGQAHVQDPDREGRDIIAVIDHVAGFDWVLKDTDGDGNPITDDPVLFAMGGSYGGGYQFVSALTEVADHGETRFNALAPDMTWFDLSRSLAPEGVVRTAWVALLYAVGIPSVAPHVHEAFVYGSTTGQWPDGTVPGTTDLDNRFFLNGPAGFVDQGIQLDIPTLITQGFSDNLFNGNEGWHNFERTLTDEAREQSLFVGYNGGHALPNVAPAGWASGGDACVESAGDLRLDFFEAVMRGENPSDLRDTRYSVTTADGDCLEVTSLAPNTAFEMDELLVEGRTLTLTGAGAVQHHEILTGPETIAGVPTLHAEVTSVGVDQRVFFALSVGTSPLNARVVQNNMMPLREPEPVLGEPRTVELPAVAVEVAEGESLFLTISPISDMSFGHGSIRTPGAVLFEDVNVDLPLVRDEEELAGCSPAQRPDHARGRVPEVCSAPGQAGR